MKHEMFPRTKHTLSINTHQFFLLLSISISQTHLHNLSCLSSMSNFVIKIFIHPFIFHWKFLYSLSTFHNFPENELFFTLHFILVENTSSLTLSLFLPLITQYNCFINPYSFISCLLSLLNVSPKPAIVHDISTQHLQIRFSFKKLLGYNYKKVFPSSTFYFHFITRLYTLHCLSSLLNLVISMHSWF